MRLSRLGLLVSVAPLSLASAQLQPADTVYDASVARPAFSRDRGPVVAIDEAHSNFHTASGRYRPFADLLRNDGFRVVANSSPFTQSTLRSVDIMVVANAMAAANTQDAGGAAFTPDEETALYEWVRSGGRLLLVADHEPMGSVAHRLAQRFGVDMSTGRTHDDPHSDWTSGSPTWLVFQRDTGALIGNHPITSGRDDRERVRRVVTFTGQSLKGPPESVALLPLAAGAMDRIGDKDVPADGRSQAIAMSIGSGRLVVFGEAAMLTAQIASAPGAPDRRFGFTWPRNDDKQLALNTVRWLAGVLP